MYDIKNFSEKAGIGLIEFNPKTKMFVDVNNSFCDFIGYSKDELISKIYTDFMFHEDVNTTNEYLKNRTLKFSKLANYINRYVHGVTGEVITIMWISDSLVYTENAEVNTAFAIDLTHMVSEYYKSLYKTDALLQLFNIMKKEED